GRFSPSSLRRSGRDLNLPFRPLTPSASWCLAGEPNVRRRPASDCILGQLALLEGRPGDAERLLANAWTQCDLAIDAELAATIALRNASQAMSRLRAAEAAEWARRALQLTRPGSPEASRGKAVLSMALAYLGRLAEAFAVLNSTELASRSELEDW